MTTTTTLSSFARKTLDELGIDVHKVEDGLVYMSDHGGGPYEPATAEAIEAACREIEGSEFPHEDDRFNAFHVALEAAERS